MAPRSSSPFPSKPTGDQYISAGDTGIRPPAGQTAPPADPLGDRLQAQFAAQLVDSLAPDADLVGLVAAADAVPVATRLIPKT